MLDEIVIDLLIQNSQKGYVVVDSIPIARER